MNVGKVIFIIIIVIFIPFICAYGDGVFVWEKGVDLFQPSQKAIILYDQGVEDLVLQVKYKGTLSEFAWVLPLPSRPEVKAVEGDIFAELSKYTQRREYWYADFGYAPRTKVEKEVKVIERKKVSVYDVAVLNATDSSTLTQWLKQNGFSVPRKVMPILNDYIEKNWTFVAIRIHPEEEKLWVEKSLNKGTLVPLKFTFSSPEIVYPLKISSLNKGETEVLIYVFYQDAVVHPDFEVQAPRAGEFYQYSEEPILEREQTERERFSNFFDFEHRFFRSVRKNELPVCEAILPRLNTKGFFLSKLRNVFKSKEMQDDIVLNPIEELSKREKYFFIKRQVGESKGKMDFSNSLLLRIYDQVVEYVANRLEKSLPINWNAFEFLAHHPSKQSLEVMELVASQPNAKIREYLGMAISRTPNPKFIPVLRKLTEDQNWNTGFYACEALGAIGNEEAIEILSELAKSKNRSHKRRCAIENLTKFSNPGLIKTYRHAIEKGNLTQDERLFCLRGLERIGDPSAYPLVEQILEQSKNKRNSDAARRLLKKWKGRDVR